MKKIGIITGASSGLGKEYASTITKKFELDECWLIARRADRLEALAKTLSVPCRILAMDLSKEGSMVQFQQLLEQEQPDIRFFIQCAGFGKVGNYKDIPLKELDRMVLVNCKAVMDLTQLCLPFAQKGARMLTISSVASFQPLPNLNVYAASKAFVTSYVRSLRWELIGKGIRLTAVCPYWIKDTEFISTTKTDTEHPNAVKNFALATTAKRVVKQSLVHNYLWLPVSTPGILSPIYRIWTKFVPHELCILVWEGLRRL